MKPNRARKNAGKKAVPTQSAIATNSTPEKPPKDKFFLRIVSETCAAENVVDEFLLPSDLDLFFRAALGENSDWSEFVTQAIREKIANRNRPEEFPITVFESTVQRLVVTLDALLNRLLTDHQNEMHPRSSLYNEVIAGEMCGYLALASDTKQSIWEAFNGIHQTLYRPATVS